MSQSCTWCGQSDGELETVTVTVPNRLGTSAREETMAVHPEHETPLREHLETVRTYAKTFLVLVGIFGVLVPLVAAFLPAPFSLTAIGGSTAVLGVVMYALPFATPETVELLGMRGARRLVRVLAAGVFALGAWILLSGWT